MRDTHCLTASPCLLDKSCDSQIPKVSLKQCVHGREPSRILAELPSISGLANSDSDSDSDSDSNSESDSNSDSDSWFDSDSDSDSDADSDSDSDNQDCQEYTLLNIDTDGYVSVLVTHALGCLMRRRQTQSCP